ncbi:MAG: hypothetical protein RL322_33 [Pseudomonadota bacterium]|jgi:dihydroorotate dehydrogenase
MMKDLYPVIRPLLFALEPERAHQLTFALLERLKDSTAVDWLTGPRCTDPVEIMGLSFPNRVGLSAGLDKNGDHIDALAALGFGFLEIGTVTPRPQPGNPKPRIFRIPRRNALINRLGFNNDGLDRLIANLERCRFRGILGLNIGKNGSTPQEQALDDYRECLTRVYPYASYVTINVSSPNTKNLRQLQGGDELDHLLGGLAETREQLSGRHHRRVPLALKIAPDLEAEQIERIAQALQTHGMDAVIATNTTVSRDAVAGEVNAGQTGGLSGAPVFEMSNAVIRQLRDHLPNDFPIIGVGGILSGRDAQAKIEAGANLVQIYTGLIYRGPSLIGECARSLAEGRSQISQSEI